MSFVDFEKYRLGIEDIDTQHRQLLDVLEDIYYLMRLKETTDKYDDIVEIIIKLKQYTVDHFSFEEKLMAEQNYQHLPKHKTKHMTFIETVETINLDDIDKMQGEHLVRLLDFVSKWLTSHINTEDRKFALYYLSQQTL